MGMIPNISNEELQESLGKVVAAAFPGLKSAYGYRDIYREMSVWSRVPIGHGVHSLFIEQELFSGNSGWAVSATFFIYHPELTASLQLHAESSNLEEALTQVATHAGYLSSTLK